MASYSRRVRRLEARGKDPEKVVIITRSKHHIAAPRAIPGRAGEIYPGQWIQIEKGKKGLL